MGGSSDKESTENKMMLLKLERMEIQMEKEKELKKLSDLEGRQVQRGKVPDYIDPVFARENNLLEAINEGNENNNQAQNGNNNIQEMDSKPKKSKKTKEKEKRSKSSKKDKKDKDERAD